MKTIVWFLFMFVLQSHVAPLRVLTVGTRTYCQSNTVRDCRFNALDGFVKNLKFPLSGADGRQ
jgi:hypothetical protein